MTVLFDKLGLANYFTTVNFSSGFHQIEFDKSDIPTAPSTLNVTINLPVMFFELKRFLLPFS